MLAVDGYDQGIACVELVGIGLCGSCICKIVCFCTGQFQRKAINDLLGYDPQVFFRHEIADLLFALYDPFHDGTDTAADTDETAGSDGGKASEFDAMSQSTAARVRPA